MDEPPLSSVGRSGPTFHWESMTGYTPSRPIPSVHRQVVQHHVKRDFTDIVSCASWLRPYDLHTFVSYRDSHEFTLDGTLVPIPDPQHPSRFMVRLSCDIPPIPHDQRPPIDLVWVIHVDTRMYWHDWLTHIIEDAMTDEDRLCVILMANEPIVFQEWTHVKQWTIERRREWYGDLSDLSLSCPWSSTLDGHRLAATLQSMVNQIPSTDIMSDEFGRLCHVMWYCPQVDTEWFGPLQTIDVRWTLLTRTPIPHDRLVLPHCQLYIARNTGQATEAIRETALGWLPHVRNLRILIPATITLIHTVSCYTHRVTTDEEGCRSITIDEWGYHRPSVIYLVGYSQSSTDGSPPMIPWVTTHDTRDGTTVTTEVALSVVTVTMRRHLLPYQTLHHAWELYELIQLWQTVQTSPVCTDDIQDAYLSVPAFREVADHISPSMTIATYLPLMNGRVAPVSVAECTEWLQHAHRWTVTRPPITTSPLVFWSDWITHLMTTEFVWVRDWWCRFRQRHVEYQEDQFYERLLEQCHTNRVHVPTEYLCPITRSLLRTPVVAADGFTYEEKAIREWFRQQTDSPSRSPMTNQVLSSCDVYPNHALRHVLAAFYDSLRNTTQNMSSQETK